MNLWKSALASLFVGVAACGGGQQSLSPPSSEPCRSTMPQERTMKDSQVITVEQVIGAFDAAWAHHDLEGVVALFAQDATLESPLVPRLLNRKEGVLHGRDEIREIVRALMQRGTPWGKHEPPIIRGHTVALEFRGPPAEGEPFFSVDIIDVEDGKIQSLRAYSGWHALKAVTGEGGRS
jgi:ketosteroid isomerase-like protein